MGKTCRTKNYNVYLVFSVTPSRFGRMIRLASGNVYNHVSFAFDKDLRKLYSFGRRRNHIPVNAGLVREYTDRFSLREADCVNVKIYQVPVSLKQYRRGKVRLRQILQDDNYLYNLYSVLFYPIFKGFYTYKAFTCVEFVMHMLRAVGVPVQTDKPAYKYLPDELDALLDYPVIFEGNLLDYTAGADICCGDFFDPILTVRERFYATGISAMVLSRLAYRKVRHSNRLARILSLITYP